MRHVMLQAVDGHVMITNCVRQIDSDVDSAEKKKTCCAPLATRAKRRRKKEDASE